MIVNATITIDAMVKAAAANNPPEWLLIGPDGRVYRGPNPLTLAAAALPPLAFNLAIDQHLGTDREAR
ncbi:MAG: hypothetical protein EOO54_03735 [Haliea sp.]|nr:MAG: hypothetical protein EOO54_03735 [Haliea sp.]